MKRLQQESFSKTMLRWETALIWIMSISFIVLAFYCIYKGFTGSLPWLSAMVGFPWSAYGVSQAAYYHKSKAENTKNGVKYEAMLLEAQRLCREANQQTDNSIDLEDNPDNYQI